MPLYMKYGVNYHYFTVAFVNLFTTNNNLRPLLPRCSMSHLTSSYTTNAEMLILTQILNFVKENSLRIRLINAYKYFIII